MTYTTKTFTVIEVTAAEEITSAVNEANMIILSSIAAIIGVWGVACMVSAISQAGGIIEMARGFMTAIGF